MVIIQNFSTRDRKPPKKPQSLGFFPFTAANGMGSEQKISCLYFCTDWGNVCGPPFDRRTVTGTRKPPSMRSDVIVEVKCLWESDTEVLGFSQFHAGSTSLCYDILY